MRKFFITICISIALLPIAEATVRRTQPVYSFSRAQKTNSSRYTRVQWRSILTPYRYRFSQTFKRADLLRWKTIEPRPYSAEQAENPISKDFCNYQDTIIGEYLPSLEAKNRCCVCLDGWKCQYSVLSGGTEQLPCDPDWVPPDTTGGRGE